MICFKILLKSSSKRLRKLRRTCIFFMFQVSPPSKFRKRMDQLRKNVLCGRKGFKKSRRRKMWRRQTFFVTIKAARNYKTKNIYIIFVIFFVNFNQSKNVRMCRKSVEVSWAGLPIWKCGHNPKTSFFNFYYFSSYFHFFSD